MKKIIILLALFTLVIAGTAFAVPILNSKHDLRSDSSAAIKANATASEICVFCHTPHNAITASAPLWNRTAATENITYSSYTTAKGNSWTPGGSSKACLSCHDGTLGASSLVNPGFNGQPEFSVATETAMAGSAASIGKAAGDLVNDHPVGLIVPVAADFAVAVAIELAGLNLYGTTNTVECGTCHDAHDTGTAALGTLPFLAKSNLASAMCTTCHIK